MGCPGEYPGADDKKVRGKEGILFRLADAAIGQTDKTVRTALHPVVGEKTLRDLVAEAKANEKVFKAKVRTTLRSSYGSYYRQMLPPLLRTLGFKCNNTAYRPVMDSLALLEKYADVDGKTRFYDAADAVPMDGVVRKDWREAVADDKGKVERIPYELCVLVALRDAIRRREIYIEGAARWRNPEDDLPGDFEATRTVHYSAIRQPLDAREFITDLKQRMTNGLDRLTAALADGSAGGVKVTTRHGEPWISVPKLEKLNEPTSLQALKDELVRRWGVLDLLDVLKNADFPTGFTHQFSSVAAYERIDRPTVQRCLLLAPFALGTNMGIRAIVATGEHGETEAALRHIRRHFITVDNLALHAMMAPRASMTTAKSSSAPFLQPLSMALRRPSRALPPASRHRRPLKRPRCEVVPSRCAVPPPHRASRGARPQAMEAKPQHHPRQDPLPRRARHGHTRQLAPAAQNRCSTNRISNIVTVVLVLHYTST